MHLPPSSHFIYIPIVLVLGVVLGFILGARATRDALNLEQRRKADKDARRLAREAKRGAAGSDSASS
jgi:hypothetical protein